MKTKNIALIILTLLSTLSFGQNLTKKTTQFWDGDLAIWKDIRIDKFKYENDLLTEAVEVRRIYNKDILLPLRKREYEYDSKGNQTLIKYFYPNEDTTDFVFRSQFEYYYNDFSLVDSLISRIFEEDETSWVFRKFLYQYDDFQRQIDRIWIQNDINPNSPFIDMTRDSIIYENDGKLKTTHYGTWIDEMWYWHSTSEMEFDDNGNMIWGWTDFSDFTLAEAVVREYNESNDLIKEEYFNQSWDTLILIWKNEFEYEKNEFGNPIKITQYYEERGFTPTKTINTFEYFCDQVLKTEYEERVIPGFNGLKYLYEYDEGVDCDLEDSNLEITIFPNPSSGIIDIESNYLWETDIRILVTDPLGRQLFREIKNPRTERWELDLSVLPRGVYFLHLDNGEVRKTEKFLIQK